MAYRHANVVGDNEPWTYWQEIDGPLIPAKPPIPPLPTGLVDWQLRAVAGAENLPPGTSLPPVPPAQGGVTRVWSVMTPISTGGISPAMDGLSSGWNGWTFALFIEPASINPLLAPYALRLTLMGSFKIDGLYIGLPDPTNDFFAIKPMAQFTFNGSSTATATMNSDGSFNPLVTDELDVSLDPTSGFWISGYFDPAGDGNVATRSSDLNWSFTYVEGDDASDVDKTLVGDETGNGWYQFGGIGSLGILQLEGLFDPLQLSG
jgi:hypothetical protein